MKDQMHWGDATVTSALLGSLSARPSSRGLFLPGGRGAPELCSYPELARRVNACAHAFLAQGVVPGSRILLPFATSVPAITAFLALVGIGALPLSIRLPGALGDLADYLAFVETLRARFGAQGIVDLPELSKFALPLPKLALPLPDQCDVAPKWAAATGEDMAFVQFSSGTTSTPKGVPIGHRQLILQLQLITQQDARTTTDVGASWLPLYHDMGLVGSLLSSVYAGHDLHLQTPTRFLLNPLDWLAQLSERRVSISALPNFGLAYLLNQMQDAGADEWEGRSFAALRRIYLGSDSIDAAVLQRFRVALEPHGLPATALAPCYGMAEAVLMVTCHAAGQEPTVTALANGQRFVSLGKAVPDFEVRIVDEDGRACAEHEIGHVLVRGPTLSSGYFESDSPLVRADGYHETGDLGFLASGELHITGRCGERIKINGQHYFLSQFEHGLRDHPGLRPEAVAVVHDGDGVAVLVEPRRGPGAPTDLLELRAELATCLLARTGVKVRGEQIHFVAKGQLRRTSSGKLMRNALAQAFRDRSLRLLA